MLNTAYHDQFTDCVHHRNWAHASEYLDAWLDLEIPKLSKNIPWTSLQSFWTSCLQTDYVETAEDKEAAVLEQRRVLSLLPKIAKNPVLALQMGMDWWVRLMDEPALFWDALLAVIKLSNYHVPSLGISPPSNWHSAETNQAFFTGIITNAPVLPDAFTQLFLKYPDKQPLLLALVENHSARFHWYQQLLSHPLKTPVVITLLTHWAEECGKRLSFKTRALSNRALLAVAKSRLEFAPLILLTPGDSQGQEQRPLYHHARWVILWAKVLFWWRTNTTLLTKAYLTYIKNPISTLKTLCSKTVRTHLKLRTWLPTALSILATRSKTVFAKVKDIALENEKAYFFWKYTEQDNSWQDYVTGLLGHIESLYEKANSILAQDVHPTQEKAIRKTMIAFAEHQKLAIQPTTKSQKALIKLSKLLEKDEKRFQKYESSLTFATCTSKTPPKTSLAPAPSLVTPNRLAA